MQVDCDQMSSRFLQRLTERVLQTLQLQVVIERSFLQRDPLGDLEVGK